MGRPAIRLVELRDEPAGQAPGRHSGQDVGGVVLVGHTRRARVPAKTAANALPVWPE